MSLSDADVNDIYRELKWVKLKNEEPTVIQKIERRGLSGILVPIGFVTTTGILASGLYYMFKKDSSKQQIFMRYRVLAQGITIGLAVLGIFSVKAS